MESKKTSKISQEFFGHNIIQRDIGEIKLELGCFNDKFEDKTFLITGGAGFLGSWFSEVALAFKAKVICVDNFIASTEENISALRRKKDFTFLNADIAEVNLPEGIDYIVHMASIASPPLYQVYPIETLNSATLGSIRVLEYARKNDVKIFLLTSTSEVYGDPPSSMVPTDEDFAGSVHSYGPRSMYDEAKRVEEAYCYAYRQQYKTPVRIVRIFNMFGPKIDAKHPSQYGRALIKFIYQALNNQPITVYGDGYSTRSFCYVKDGIVGLYKLLFTDGMDGEVINIGNDKEITILELAQKIKEVAESESEILTGCQPAYNLAHDPRRRCPNITKARQLLGFNPTVTLEEGLERLISWIRFTQTKQ